MKKGRRNNIRRMAACSFAAFMAAVLGTGFGMTACAEKVIDNEQEIQEAVPESENKDALPAEDAAADKEGLEVMKVVVIEEDQVPKAAVPEMDGEDEEMAEAPSEAEVQDPEEAEEMPQTSGETSAEGFAGTLQYDDSEVLVTVTVSEAAQLPADTQVKVRKLKEGSAKYEAAKEAARQSVGAGENASYTFYDVTLESEGQALDVEEGTVSVRMEFKTDTEKEVVKIEETEGGKVARNVTDRAAAGKTGSVEISY